MEQFVLYLFYIAIVLVLGLLVTTVSNIFRVPNILFLVLAGYILHLYGFDFFDSEIILVLSALAVILIALESAMELDVVSIVQNFLNVLKFSIAHLLLCAYILTLGIFQIFDLPGKGFETFVLCLLLSIIIWGVDPAIALEFFKVKKSKVQDMLNFEGIISSPIVVVFSLFTISYLITAGQSFSYGVMSQTLDLVKQVVFALLIGLILAFLAFKLLNLFKVSGELFALFIVTIAILAYVSGEFAGTDGTLTIAVYGIFLRGLTKQPMPKKYTTFFAHTLYLMVFILIGLKFILPAFDMWLKGIALFIAYLILRFMSVVLFMKELNFKEKLFMTLNVSKGIEAAIVLFIIDMNFKQVEGITIILSLGYMFFILSYVVSTVINHFSEFFLEQKKKTKNMRKK
jgi:NhaP-type Na+/H+ or K+/H+ antiporter